MKKEKNIQKTMGNKGFSLVELIIVMAIMAILVGIVGTQAIPYMNRAREAKDQQVLSGYATAATVAYTQLGLTGNISVDVYNDSHSGDALKMVTQIKELTYNSNADLRKALGSKTGETIDDIRIAISGSSLTVYGMAGSTVLSGGAFEVNSQL